MLTKEQKMKMVSDAIDAGFSIEMTYYDASIEKMDELIKIFNGLPVSMKNPCDRDHKIAWATINSDVYHSSKDEFAIDIHLA